MRSLKKNSWADAITRLPACQHYRSRLSRHLIRPGRYLSNSKPGSTSDNAWLQQVDRQHRATKTAFAARVLCPLLQSAVAVEFLGDCSWIGVSGQINVDYST